MYYTENNNGKLVGIVSYNIHSIHLNHGAVLHSYAFQQYLKKQGVDSVILNYKPTGHLEHYNLKYPVLNYKGRLEWKKLYEHFRDWGCGFFHNLRRYNKFQRFFQKYYITTRQQYSQKRLMEIKELEELGIDIWVCECDVIWKLYKNKGFDDIFFLNAPFMKNARKVAYAPSMGARQMTQEEKERFVSLVMPFEAISCREKESVDLVSELLHRNVTLALDSVFLLNAEDYKKIAILPKEKKYLLLYNCIKNDHTMIRQAHNLADRLGLQMVEISTNDYHRFRFDHVVRTDVGIEEFLGYFINADYVVSNSFHGCCFSIIFHKQFFLFQRDKSDYRMSSLTREIGCEDRFILLKNQWIPEDIEPIDFDMVDKKRFDLLKISTDFIKENIIKYATY